MYRRACTQTLFISFSNALKGPTSDHIFQNVFRSRIVPMTANLCPNITTRFYSKKVEQEGKLLYYGLLTPQIKACKVIFYKETLFLN